MEVTADERKIILKQRKLPTTPPIYKRGILKHDLYDFGECPEDIIIDIFPITYPDSYSVRNVLTLQEKNKFIKSLEKSLKEYIIPAGSIFEGACYDNGEESWLYTNDDKTFELEFNKELAKKHLKNIKIIKNLTEH